LNRLVWNGGAPRRCDSQLPASSSCRRAESSRWILAGRIFNKHEGKAPPKRIQIGPFVRSCQPGEMRAKAGLSAALDIRRRDRCSAPGKSLHRSHQSSGIQIRSSLQQTSPCAPNAGVTASALYGHLGSAAEQKRTPQQAVRSPTNDSEMIRHFFT